MEEIKAYKHKDGSIFPTVKLYQDYVQQKAAEEEAKRKATKRIEYCKERIAKYEAEALATSKEKNDLYSQECKLRTEYNKYVRQRIEYIRVKLAPIYEQINELNTQIKKIEMAKKLIGKTIIHHKNAASKQFTTSHPNVYTRKIESLALKRHRRIGKEYELHNKVRSFYREKYLMEEFLNAKNNPKKRS